MKPTLSLSVLAAVLASIVVPAFGHTYLTNISVGGEKQSEGKCIVKPSKKINTPEMDPNSDAMRCRAMEPTLNEGDYCDVAAGSTMTIHFHEGEPDSRAIDPTHMGPVMAYMSRAEHNGIGDVWFKIYEDGYIPESNHWAIDTLVKEDGKVNLVIPADLAPGQYLVRGEVISLHEAERQFGDDETAGAQYYPSCARINVSGTGTAVPKGYPIPGIYKIDDPGISINVWDDEGKPYTIPGPPVYVAGSSAGGAANGTANAAPAQSPSAAAPVGSSSSADTTAPSSGTSSGSSSSGSAKSCIKKRGKGSGKRSKRSSRNKRHQEM